MRSLLFVLDMLCLLPIAIARPFVGVLLWDWIAFENPHRIVWGFGVDWPWGWATFAATTVGWIVTREKKQLPVNATTLLMMAFMIGITVNMPFALAHWDGEYAGWLRTVKMFVFFLITAALLTDKRRIDALIWMIAISLGYWIVDQGGASVVTLGHHTASGPPDSMIADNNIFAAALLVLLPMLNYLRLQAANRMVRYGVTFVMVLSFLTTVASYSRGAFLGIIAVGIVMWWRGRNKLIGVLVLAVAAVAVVLFMPESWFARMHTIDHYHHDASAEGRLYIWRVAWLLALHHPLTGAGFHATIYRDVVDTVVPGGMTLAIHGIWFQVLGQQGFPVFFVWVALSVVAWFNGRQLTRLARGRPELRWADDLGRMVQVSVVAYAVTGTFLPIAYWDIYFTVLVAVQMALVLVRRQLADEAAGQRFERRRKAAWTRDDILAIPAPGRLAARSLPRTQAAP